MIFLKCAYKQRLSGNCFELSTDKYTRVTKVLAPWLNFTVQLASSQPPPMALKAEMQSNGAELSNFYSPLIQAEEDMQSGKLEAFLSYHPV